MIHVVILGGGYGGLEVVKKLLSMKSQKEDTKLEMNTEKRAESLQKHYRQKDNGNATKLI